MFARRYLFCFCLLFIVSLILDRSQSVYATHKVDSNKDSSEQPCNAATAAAAGQQTRIANGRSSHCTVAYSIVEQQQCHIIFAANCHVTNSTCHQHCCCCCCAIVDIANHYCHATDRDDSNNDTTLATNGTFGSIDVATSGIAHHADIEHQRVAFEQWQQCHRCSTSDSTFTAA